MRTLLSAQIVYGIHLQCHLVKANYDSSVIRITLLL